MIVADASAILEVLLRTTAAERIEERLLAAGESLHVPHLLDLEVTQVLRRHVRAGALGAIRAEQCIDDLLALRLIRHSHVALLERIWKLRDVMTAYDAAYVALAEGLGAPLITRDARLARALGHAAQIELI